MRHAAHSAQMLICYNKEYRVRRESKIVDGTPDKRLFWSIITDYSLDTSVCELIDNSIDIWTRNNKQRSLKISVDLDVVARSIRISDNAGGVPEHELQKLISPGATTNDPNNQTIGIFGVGSKRAVVALAEIIRIQTRHNEGKSFQIDIDNSWLESPDWDMPVYEIDEIEAGTTSIALNGLRFELIEEASGNLRNHLSETYALFLARENIEIIFNGNSLDPRVFDNWAYPPGFEPRYYMFEITPEPTKKVGVEIYGGLIVDRDPVTENYGVYFYCNDRLIMKDIKDREVGYIKGYAGIPHPNASLARVIIKFIGPAE
jgi:hypothetical protein